MKIPEPAHLVGVGKVCPQPSCQSTDVKWRYYNNWKVAGTSQPRYKCMTCEGMFTYGGKTRLSKVDKRLREADEVAAKEVEAEKKLAAREAAKRKADKRAAKEAARELADLGAVEEPRRISSSLHRIASPIGKAKKVPSIIRLRLHGGAVIDLPAASEVEIEVGGDVSPAVMQEGESAALESGPTALESAGADVDCEPEASSESGSEGHYAHGEWVPQVETEAGAHASPAVMEQGGAPLESGSTAPESLNGDFDNEVVGRWDAGAMDCYSFKGMESELDVAEPESLIITGSAPNSRSWECIFS